MFLFTLFKGSKNYQDKADWIAYNMILIVLSFLSPCAGTSLKDFHPFLLFPLSPGLTSRSPSPCLGDRSSPSSTLAIVPTGR